MFHLIPHIKSAYQIRSYVRMDIKRGMYLICNYCIEITILFNLNNGILHCSWSGKTALILSPKKILNFDLSLLKCTEFFHRLQKLEPVSNFRLYRFLYRGGSSGIF